MGIVFVVFGVIMMIPVVMFLTMCMANIVFVDSLIAATACAVVAGITLHLHPVCCILTAFAAFCGVTWISLREKGFMALTAVSTLSWAYIAGFLVNDITDGDRLWAGFTFLVTAAMVFLLHMNVKRMLGLSR